MNTIKLILIIGVIVIIQSCYKPGKIRVQNNISQVKITSVMWGDIDIASELMPGETSSKRKIAKYDKKLPSSQKISFIMSANNKSIYLETEEKYLLDEDDDLLIVLTDSTKVENPNE